MNKNLYQKLLVIIAVLAVGLGLCFCALANDNGITTWADLQAELDKGGTVTLTQDLIPYSTDTALKVKTGKTVTLDMNGHTLDRGLSNLNAMDGGNVITVNGELTVKGGGIITGGNNSTNGGGVYVYGTGRFTMENCTITGNKSSWSGGGVYVDVADNEQSGSFTMNSGTIEKNRAADKGGGVCAVYMCGVYVNAGSVRDNEAGNDGGGIYLENAGLSMTGGSVTGNKPGGVIGTERSAFSAYGNPVIKNNTDGKKARNIDIGTNIVLTGALTKGAELHVYRGLGDQVATYDHTSQHTYHLTDDDAAKFFSDLDSILIGTCDNGYIVLKKSLKDVTVTLASTSAVYNGENMDPVIVTDGKTTLENGTDYSLSYKKDGKDADNIKDVGAYVVTITGQGKYRDPVTKNFAVTPKPVTITGLSVLDKVYDGNTAATITGTPAIVGIVNQDDVTVATKDPAAAFEDKVVGKKKKVSFTGYSLKGGEAANYSLPAQPTTTATITPKSVTVSGAIAINRAYEPDNRTVMLMGGTLIGVVDGDLATVDHTKARGTMVDANVGEDKPIVVTGLAAGGPDGINYSVSAQPDDLTVMITQAENPMTVVPAAMVKAGGNTVDLSANVRSAEGPVTYAITVAPEGCLIGKDTGVLTSGPETGICMVTVTAAGNTNYLGASATVTVIVTDKETQALAFAEQAVTKTYGDAPFINALSGAKTDVAYSVAAGTDVASVASDGTVTILKAGTAMITVTAAESGTVAGATASYMLTVNKAEPSVTAPAAVMGLIYTGEAQKLLTAGSADGGTMQYALGADDTSAPVEGWRKAVPAATEVGTYYAWYRVVGDANHLDMDPACITVTIADQQKTDITGAKIIVRDREYTGEAITPKLAVKFSGKKLKVGTDYTVSFRNNREIGTASVTVTGTGDYTGKAKASFKIIPKKISLTGVKAGKKSLTVCWKPGEGIDGYEIEYSLKKDFRDAKTVIIKKARTADCELTKLKSKKRYYVRIRSFKKVKGKKYCSDWSKVLSGKTD